MLLKFDLKFQLCSSFSVISLSDFKENSYFRLISPEEVGKTLEFSMFLILDIKAISLLVY